MRASNTIMQTVAAGFVLCILSVSGAPQNDSLGDAAYNSFSHFSDKLEENNDWRPEDANKAVLNSKKPQMVRHFYLWTRDNAGNSSYQLLNPLVPNNISRSIFSARKTFVIVHGFLGWGNEPWILHLKDMLLNVTNSNVISVDWPAGNPAFLPSYYFAVNRVPVVANDTVLLLQALAEIKNLHLKDVHLIGHSLGAHIAGYTGMNIKGRIGRITGLDPAGLMYHKVSAKERLDSSHAEYVDIMHTNGCYSPLNPWLGCYGLNENHGHSDFWPNGGKHQPACKNEHKHKKLKGEIGCSHEMAYVYYIESINYGIDDTYFFSRNCSNYTDYTHGVCSCGDVAQYMGFYVNTRVRGVFYLNTSARSPYAMRDSVCTPGGRSLEWNVRTILILASGGTLSTIAVFASLWGLPVFVKRYRRGFAVSGLVVEEENEDTCDDEILSGLIDDENGVHSDDDLVY